MKVKKWILGLMLLAFGISATVVGVYSANTNNISINGQVQFSATNCSVSVVCNVYNTAQGSKSFSTMVASSETTSYKSLNIGTVNFSNLNEQIVVEMIITNTTSTYVKGSINVDPKGNLADKVTFLCNGQNILPYTFEMQSGEEFTYSIQYSTNSSVNVNMDLGISLDFERYEISSIDNLSELGYSFDFIDFDNLSISATSLFGVNYDYESIYLSGVPSSTTLGSTDIILPRFVQSYDGSYVELGCLGNFSVSGSTVTFSAINNINTYFNVAVQEGVKCILANAFNNCKAISRVLLPDSIECVGDYVFEGCSAKENIPKGIKYVGALAFTNVIDTKISDLTELKSIKSGYDNSPFPSSIYDSVLDLSFLNSTTVPSFIAFTDAVTAIIIPEYITAISDNAFLGCVNLVNIIIPNSVTSIGDYAFVNCFSLTTLTIPDSVTSIGVGALNGTYALTTLTLPFWGSARNTETSSRPTAPFSSLTRVPSTLTTISITDTNYVEAYSFEGMTSIKYVYLCKKVSRIYEYAFSGCTSLEYVSLDGDLEIIQKYAFNNCTSLGLLFLSEKITYVDDTAFDGCGHYESFDDDTNIYTLEGCVICYLGDDWNSGAIPPFVREHSEYLSFWNLFLKRSTRGVNQSYYFAYSIPYVIVSYSDSPTYYIYRSGVYDYCENHYGDDIEGH